MIQPRSNHSRSVVAIVASLVLAAFGTTFAQPALALDLEVLDARGTVWDISGGDALVDLEGVSDRRLELRAGPVVGGAASISVAIDGAVLAPIDLEFTERELAVTVATDAQEIIAASTRDPLVWPAGFTYSSGDRLMLGVDPRHGEQLVYVAFDELNVASGDQVEYAAVRFTAIDSRGGPLTLRVFALTAPLADARPQDAEGTASGTLTAAAKTQRFVDWVLESSWSAGEIYETPDLSALVAEAWADPATRASGSLGFVFAIADGAGTRRAWSVEGRQRSAPELVLRVREPESAALPIDVPAAAGAVTVTLYPERAGGGDPIASVTFRVASGTAVAATEPEPAAELAAPPAPSAAPEPAAPPSAAPEPAAPPAPAAAPAVVDSGPSIWVADLDARDERSSLVTVVLHEPVSTDFVPALRFGTCAALGDMLIELDVIRAGERGTSTIVRVPTPVLRLSGVVAVLDGVPGACAPLRP